MHNNTHIQTVTTDVSRNREREPSNSETFVRLNVLDYKWAEQSDRFIQFWLATSCVNKKVAVAFEQKVAVAYSYVSQAVIFIIIIVSVKLYSGT